MAGFASEKQVGSKREDAIRQFLRQDPRFRNQTPKQAAEHYRQKDLTTSRLEQLHRPISADQLFNPVEEMGTRHFYGEEQADGYEVENGYWLVRVATYTRLLQGKVSRIPDWEIQLKTSTATRMVFPAVIRERIIRHQSEEVYEQWRKEVLSTEDKLREALTEACRQMKQPMAASWVTSPSSQRLLERMGIQTSNEWGFLFRDQTF